MSWEICHDHDQDYWSDDGCPVCDARAEVEALRRENERLKEAVDVAQEATKFARLDCDMYKTEVERLRAALQGETG